MKIRNEESGLSKIVRNFGTAADNLRKTHLMNDGVVSKRSERIIRGIYVLSGI